MSSNASLFEKITHNALNSVFHQWPPAVPHHQAPPSSMQLGQSEAAEPLPHSDSLSRLQVEAEVFRSFEQQNDGGAKVKLPHRRALLQDHALSLYTGHAPFTSRLHHLVVDGNVAAVLEGAFTVARSVGLKLLKTKRKNC